MTRRKPWPDEAAANYWDIRTISNMLNRLFIILLDDGLAKNKPEVIDRLLPLITSEAEEIILHCARIQAERTSYWPKWAIKALENINLLATEIKETTRIMKKAHRRGDVLLIERLAILARGYSQKITGQMLSGPAPGEPVDIHDLVDEVINNYDNGVADD